MVIKARKDILEKAEAENRNFTAEESEAWTKIMGGTGPDGAVIRGQVDLLKDRIDAFEKVDGIDAENKAVVTDPTIGRGRIHVPKETGTDGAEQVSLASLGRRERESMSATALSAWCAYQMDLDLTAEQEAACKITGMRPERKHLPINLPHHQYTKRIQHAFTSFADKDRGHGLAELESDKGIRAALSAVSGPAGAYLFPETFVRQLEVNMLAYGGILQAADIMRTASGERIAWPTADDTGNKGRRLNENQAINYTPDPTFGQVYWDAYEYTSDCVLVPYALLQDSIFDLPTILGEMLGERLGRKFAIDDTLGTGANQPKGIVTCAPVGVTAASTTALLFDEVLSLIFSVDPAYRSAPGCRFLFHDQTLAILRKLKDSQNRYLWDPSVQVGIPDKIWGYPYTISMEMAQAAALAVVMIFGDLKKFKIRQVGQVRMYRLQERFRDNDQDGFVAFMRQDANLLTAGTAPLKAMAMHA